MSKGVLYIVGLSESSGDSQYALIKLSVPSTAAGKAFDYAVQPENPITYYSLISSSDVSFSFFTATFDVPHSGRTLVQQRLAGFNTPVRLSSASLALSSVPTLLTAQSLPT